MNQLKTSLSTLAAMASLLGVVACGSSNKTQANSPSSAQAPAQEQSGSTMGQPGNTAGTGTENNPQSATTPGSSGETPQGATTGAGQGGTQNSGSMGMGSESNAPHTIGGGSSANTPMTGPTTGSPSTQSGSMDTSSLTDGQVAGVLQAANQAQIQQALLAQSKASSPEVKRFARQMVTHYRSVQTKESALFARLQISPSESTMSNEIRTNAQDDLSALQSSKGKDFDRSYIDAEVKHLQDVSDMADRAMRDSRSSELKTELQNVRTKVDTQLREAQRIQQSQESGK